MHCYTVIFTMNNTAVAVNAAAGCEVNKVKKIQGEQADNQVEVWGLSLSKRVSGHFKFVPP